MSHVLYHRNRQTRRVTDAEGYWAARDLRIEAARGDSIPQPTTLNPQPLMQTAHYIEDLIMCCSDETFGQDAVLWGIMNNKLELSYNLETDLRIIMGPPRCMLPPKEPRLYDRLIEEYQARQQADADALFQSAAPLLNQIESLRAAA